VLTEGLQGLLVGLVPAALRSATPLLWALLGETVTQRAGVVNLGVEGQMLVGAAAAFGVTVHTGQPWLGLAAGAVSGAVLSLCHVALCLHFRANQFASGMAVWMVGYGTSSFVGAKLVGESIDGFRTLADSAVGRAVPFLGRLTPTVVLALFAAFLCGWFVYRTRPGLSLRAVGESSAAAAAAGVPVTLVRCAAIVAGGVFSGMGGAALSIDCAQAWAEGMTKGRGLVAVGLVIVARYNPWLALPCALLFGGAEALVLRVQSAGSDASSHLLQMLPYLLSLFVLIVTCLRPAARAAAPSELRAVLDR
jgi:simple sugar transport system permease protein